MAFAQQHNSFLSQGEASLGLHLGPFLRSYMTAQFRKFLIKAEMLLPACWQKF